MRRTFFISALLCVLPCWAALGQAPDSTAPQTASQPSYYVSNGDDLEAVVGDPARANYSTWQVWLYPHSMRVGRSGSGLAYVRWGAIQRASSGAAMRQLAVYQQFEQAYAKFFGRAAWGPFTFSYAVGPIALTGAAQPDSAATLLSHIDHLNQQLQGVVEELTPSLANNQPNDGPPLVQAYFQQVRNSMQDVARFYDKLARLPAQRDYLYQELAVLTPGVSQAESGAAQVTAFLPWVKLPADRNWMSYSQNGGKDGTHSVKITEIGSNAWVQESWTGGDGSMAGTKVITIVPFQRIGSLDVWVPAGAPHAGWTLVIHSANSDGFPEHLTSPLRSTATRTYPAVDLTTTERSVYFEFSSPSAAQDAYAYFLYHKQRGS